MSDDDTGLSAFDRHKREELRRIQQFAQAQTERQFFSHRSAALLWGAPVPHRPGALVHASVLAPRRSPRATGVVGHNLRPEFCVVTEMGGLRLTTPASTWAQLGELSVPELVAIGDFFVRKHRPGYGRRNVGRKPLATISELADTMSAGRRRGAAKLRSALVFIREDSWSPQESMVRVELLRAGLPEPELNRDVFDADGVFLGCLDMSYREYKVGVEYQGEQHGKTYAADVERLAALRADGWDMIEVTRTLARCPSTMVGRVAQALRERGWPGPPIPPHHHFGRQ